jgi:hypothetical protein
MVKNLLDKVLVINFASGERTEKLSEYCFKKLGFENILTIGSETGFVDKFIRCAEIALESKCEIFVRSDADRLVFDGLLDLIDKFIEEKLDCAEGYGHEYFMNCFRGATPHVFSKKVFQILANDNSLMPDVQKPENHFVNNLVNKGLIKEKTFKILTNLHEYEQFPSKVCNSFLNRIARGHLGYYDLNYLKNLKEYNHAINHALNETNKFSNKKKSMNHEDYSYLDDKFLKINNDEIGQYYLHCLQIYQKVNLNYR